MGDTPKWMVYSRKNIYKWMDWGYPYFRTPPFGHVNQVLNIHDMTIEVITSVRSSCPWNRDAMEYAQPSTYIYTLYIHVRLASIINALWDMCPFRQVASRNAICEVHKAVGQDSPIP